MADKPISFRVPRPLMDEILRRARDATAHQAARLAVARYYTLCRLHDPRRWLTDAELAIVCEVCSAVVCDTRNSALDLDDVRVRSIWMEVADAIAISRRSPPDPTTGAPQLLARHRRNGEPPVNGDELVTKLQCASYADLVALADFVERHVPNDPDEQEMT
jgi:hypothetical protein